MGTREHDGKGIVLSVLLMLTLATVLVLSGCLVEEEEGDGGLEVPEDRRDATLEVVGEVDDPLTLGLEELIDLGTEEFEATFVNAVGTTETANYTGVRLQKVLDLAKVRSTAEIVEVEAEDGYRPGLFLTDVTDDTYLAMLKEGKWQTLVTDGALRLVDTNLPSTYWVRQVVRLNLTVSMSIEVSGLANVTDPISAAHIHANGEEIHWKEGIKNRTGRGIPMIDVLAAIDADIHWGYLIDVHHPVGGSVLVPVQEVLSGGQHYLAEERAQIKYVREGLIWKAPISSISITPGIKVLGEVGEAMCMTVKDLRALPVRDVESGGSTYRGAALEAVIAMAGPDADVDAVNVIGKDGYSAVFPFANLSTTTLAYEVDGTPLGPEDGYLRIVDSARPGNYHVSQVIWLDVYRSIPITIEGGDVSKVIDLG